LLISAGKLTEQRIHIPLEPVGVPEGLVKGPTRSQREQGTTLLGTGISRERWKQTERSQLFFIAVDLIASALSRSS
jgi:hypothetical protein